MSVALGSALKAEALLHARGGAQGTPLASSPPPAPAATEPGGSQALLSRAPPPPLPLPNRPQVRCRGAHLGTRWAATGRKVCCWCSSMRRGSRWHGAGSGLPGLGSGWSPRDLGTLPGAGEAPGQSCGPAARFPTLSGQRLAWLRESPVTKATTLIQNPSPAWLGGISARLAGCQGGAGTHSLAGAAVRRAACRWHRGHGRGQADPHPPCLTAGDLQASATPPIPGALLTHVPRCQ